jgi:hypothetical protein
MRTALAYLYSKESAKKKRIDLSRGVGIEGLVCVGRNGEFSHALKEDVFWRTRRKVLPLIDAARCLLDRRSSRTQEMECRSERIEAGCIPDRHLPLRRYSRGGSQDA